MHKLIALLALLSTRAFATPDSKATLSERFHIDLADSDTTEAWTDREAQLLLGLISTFPAKLQEVAAATRFGTIKLSKVYGPEPEATTHNVPSILYWQLTLYLASKDETLLKRTFTHHLLHVLDAHTEASENYGWRSASGWRPRQYFGLDVPFLLKEADNQDPRAYASELGQANPAEDFATFGELYFVTPETKIEDSIACRTPDKYHYFRRLFADYKPYLEQSHIKCRTSDEGFLDDVEFFHPITKKPLKVGPVNAETVTGFELLYATPGVNDAAEIAGHLMLRMKIKDSEDLVLSFLADTDHDQAPTRPADVPKQVECKRETPADFDAMRQVIQSLKGLAGGFLTTFDRQLLWQAVKTYTVDQDRNLLRYELVLSREQKVGLIERLFVAKKSFRAKYYFFDRNCGSILVQVLGEGIGDDEVASFDPFVVPPNALVAMLVRKGLARPAHPAFYSYRKKGFVAQEMMVERARTLPIRGEDLRDHDQDVRLATYKKMHILAANHSFHREIFQIASLGQDAELAYLDKKELCEDVTPTTTVELRSIQKAILALDHDAAKKYRLDTNEEIYRRYRDVEQADSATGSPHTALSATRLSFARFDDELTLGIGGALHKQDMGAMTSEAMQRATAVELGVVEAFVDSDRKLQHWRVTGLKIKKLKERIHDVPSYYDEDGKLGIGLTLLDIAGTAGEGPPRTTLAGGALIANLWSTRLYNRYIHASLGGDLVRYEGRTHIVLPMRFEALWTFDAARRWQLRGDSETRWTVGKSPSEARRERAAHVSLAYRMAEFLDAELLVWLGAGYQESLSGEAATNSHHLLQMGMEWHRW